MLNKLVAHKKHTLAWIQQINESTNKNKLCLMYMKI